MKDNKSIVLMLAICLCFPVLIFAETIILKSGETVEGKLLEKTDEYIKIDFQGVPLTYFIDEVNTIDGKPANASSGEVAIEILNPGYTKPPDESNNVEISPESDIQDIMKKLEYYYSTRDFDKAIELGEAALKKTTDRNLLGEINYSLSSNYLEKGIDAYSKNKDDSFYKLSIQFAKKALEVFPDSWQALGNIGTVYFNMKDWQQAIYYLTQAEKYIDKSDPSYASLELTRNFAERMSQEKL